MCRLKFLITMMLLGFFVNAQKGYWYDTSFIELNETNKDVVYAIESDSKQYRFNSGRFISNLDRKNSYYIAYKRITQFGDSVVVLPQIRIGTKNEILLNQIINEYSDLLYLEQTSSNDKYKITCFVNSDDEVLDIVSAISKHEGIDWCEPCMLIKIVLSNALYPLQYYLNNTGQNGGTSGIDINAESAWQITTGSSSIKVAVIDTGVDKNHEDFGSNVLSGYTINDSISKGSPTETFPKNPHGTACAGIIGAINNSIGIRGVASGVKIIPINIFSDSNGFINDDSVANAIRWAYQRADILSCSWGSQVPSTEITLALNEATTMGRNGKGCIVVAAAGNYAQYNLPVQFPARLPNVIAVGAIDNTGTICPYSCRGADLNLVAPSGIGDDIHYSSDIVTTDRMGGDGYVNGNYYYHFNGTSAACPQVAGVAALMLSTNSYLPESRAREILQSTAHSLSTNVPDNTYGYGLVDAGGAVIQAKAEKPSFTTTKTYNGENEMTINVSYIPSYFMTEWTVLAGNMTISSAGSNYCTLTKSTSGLPNGVVKINVKYGSSVVYSTVISLNVSDVAKYMQNACTYYNVGHPAIPLTVINSGGQAHVHQGCRVYLYNEAFGLYQHYGNISHSGVTPDDWYVGNNNVQFALPLGSGGIPFGVQVRDDNGTLKYQYIFFSYSGNGNSSLSINPLSSSEYEISLSEGDDCMFAESNENLSLCVDQEQSWKLEIFNTLDASKVYEQVVSGDKIIINTSGWRVGTYAICAIRGEQTYSEKILVK